MDLNFVVTSFFVEAANGDRKRGNARSVFMHQTSEGAKGNPNRTGKIYRASYLWSGNPSIPDEDMVLIDEWNHPWPPPGAEEVQ